jgi:NAD(P)-dependent dehydrogenase (short-subunit alcohol dehydrogenase family)
MEKKMSKNYLLIGGNSGIGKATAEMLLEEGHNVITASRSDDSINGAEHIKLDVTQDFKLDDIPEQIDGLAYFPGSINLKPFHRLKPEEFISDFNINLIGTVKVIQAVLNNLKKSENASVVLFSTVAVQTGMPFHASVASAKGAIEGLTRSLAAEYAPKIRFNAIAPSLTDTPMAERLLSNDKKRESLSQNHPLQRVGKPEDIAKMVRFLLTDDSSWITGQIYHIDGGMGALK